MQLLQPYRDRIDALDDEIVALLARRFDVIREVAALKNQHGIPAVLEDRVRQVIDRAADHAGPENADMTRELYTLLVTICCDLEEQLMDESRAGGQAQSG